MWPSGAGRRGSGQNPARAGGGVGREPRGEGLRDAMDRFGLDLGVEACGGAQRRRPLQPNSGVGCGEVVRLGRVVVRVSATEGLERVVRW
jgi:hypothetical protein